MFDDFLEVEYLEEDISKYLYIPKSSLGSGQIVNILRRMLYLINPTYIELAERTAFCSIRLFDYARINNKYEFNINRNDLILLSVLFTIGAYKDEFNETLERVSPSQKKDVSKIFLFSFLYLKHMTPLKEIAESVLLYKCSYENAKKLDCKYIEYASLLFTCMRICVKLRDVNYNDSSVILDEDFVCKVKKMYNPIYFDLFIEANQNDSIVSELKNKNYKTKLDDYCNSLIYNYDDSFLLLKMLIYSVDFVSTSTVTHIINTAFHATELCGLVNLSDEQINDVFTAAVIHDIGKLAINIDILESTEQLTAEQVQIMRTHVEIGDKICRKFVGDVIADIAFRHHETLDGTGYPKGIGGKDLTLPQQVLAIGDIFSALTDARTYKPSFSKEKTLSILKSLSDNNKLDKKIILCIEQNYEQIVENTKIRRPMLTTNLGYVMVEYMLLKDCNSIGELFYAIHYDFAKI